MQTTENLGLKLQEVGDFADIEMINENFEKLDSEVPKKIDKNNPTGTGYFSMNRKAGTEVGAYSHAEGYRSTASGECSHAEGNRTTASGSSSHAEGYANENGEQGIIEASGDGSHAEGYADIVIGGGNSYIGKIQATGKGAHAEGYAEAYYGYGGDDYYGYGLITTASGDGAHAEGIGTTASGVASHSQGKETEASGICSHSEGFRTTANGTSSHAEGDGTEASGSYSHAEGFSTEASELASHSEGSDTVASGSYSHSEGCRTKSIGSYSHSEGFITVAKANYSHAGGLGTEAYSEACFAFGKYNTVPARQITANDASLMVIGNGSSDSSKSNALRLDYVGCLRTAGTITASTTADYAEFFEWLDGNVDNEDRVGKFVTLDGNNIRIATDKDDYILGVISGEPFVLGNGDCDVWNGMYLRDKFRRRLLEPAPKTEFVLDENGKPTGEQKEVLDENGNVVYEGERLVLNPEYDNTKPYISRADRPEWDAVGMLGVLPVIHDGTAKVNGYVTVNKDGIATACEKTHENAYRVIHVNADDVVEIIFR